MILFLLVVTATFQPAAPTVGDPITLTFAQPPVLEPSAQYELVRQERNRVIIRTFEPRPIVLHGHTGGVRFENLIIPVHSVLKQGDDMKPAPLKPPRPLPEPRVPWIALGAAALAALAAWIAVVLLARRRIAPFAEPALPPRERFLAVVASLRSSPNAAMRWATLADATRTFLAATTHHLGAELTTAELLTRAGDHAPLLAEILRRGDLEKFSPWGAPSGDFDAVAQRALELAPEPVVAEEVAA